MTLGLVTLGPGQRLELGWVGTEVDEGIRVICPHLCSVMEASWAPRKTVTHHCEEPSTWVLAP